MIHTQRKITFGEPRSLRSKSGGIVLVVALILLVVMTVSSVVAMRGATSSDVVSNNIRSQNLALQAAELALRHCERVVLSGAMATPLQLNNGAIINEWQTAANWSGATGVVTVPTATLGTTVPYSTAPQCLIRLMSYDEMYGSINMNFTTVRPSDRGLPENNIYMYRITARGFSPDFRRDGSGVPTSGSQAWVQSTLRMVL